MESGRCLWPEDGWTWRTTLRKWVSGQAMHSDIKTLGGRRLSVICVWVCFDVLVDQRFFARRDQTYQGVSLVMQMKKASSVMNAVWSDRGRAAHVVRSRWSCMLTPWPSLCNVRSMKNCPPSSIQMAYNEEHGIVLNHQKFRSYFCYQAGPRRRQGNWISQSQQERKELVFTRPNKPSKCLISDWQL